MSRKTERPTGRSPAFSASSCAPSATGLVASGSIRPPWKPRALPVIRARRRLPSSYHTRWEGSRDRAMAARIACRSLQFPPDGRSIVGDYHHLAASFAGFYDAMRLADFVEAEDPARLRLKTPWPRSGTRRPRLRAAAAGARGSLSWNFGTARHSWRDRATGRARFQPGPYRLLQGRGGPTR